MEMSTSIERKVAADLSVRDYLDSTANGSGFHDKAAMPGLKTKIPGIDGDSAVTLANGNCAFNAMVIGIMKLVLSDQLANNKSFIERATTLLNLTDKSITGLKQWLRANSQEKWQLTFQKMLREIAVEEILNCYETHYKSLYEANLWAAYENRNIPQFDDTFIMHRHIREKFKENELTQNALNEWWEQLGNLSKSPKDIYFANLKESARHAFDRERWGGVPEILAIALFFKINVEWVKGPILGQERLRAPALLGICGGLLSGLSSQFIKVLVDLNIGQQFGNDVLIYVFRDQISLQQAMHPKTEPLKTLIENYVVNCPIEAIQVPQKINHYVLQEADKKTLKEWNILSNRTTFLNNTGLLAKERILSRLNGVPQELQKLVLECFVRVPCFKLQNTGSHWNYCDNTIKDVPNPASQKESLPLSDAGLLNEVTKGAIIKVKRKLQKEDLAALDEVYQKYYLKLKEKNGDKAPLPWEFGFIDYIQTICCGEILKKRSLVNIEKEDFRCPVCGEEEPAEIQDQLYCMYSRLFPSNNSIISSYRESSLRMHLTLKLFRSAIEKGHHFLLEQLLLIALNKQYINYHDEHGMTLLHYAIESNDKIAMLILLKHGADADSICAFLYRPLEYINRLIKDKLLSGDMGPLQRVLKSYSAAVSKDEQTDSHGQTSELANPTLSYEGTRLHLACKWVEEALVHDLCNFGNPNVNSRNCSNYTPLAMLAYFGLGNNSISISHFLNILANHKITLGQSFELLLKFREANYIVNKKNYQYFKPDAKFSLFDEVRDYFSCTRKNRLNTADVLCLKMEDESSCLLCSTVDNWSNPKQESLYDTELTQYLKSWCSHQGGFVPVKLIIPCEFGKNLAIALADIQLHNGERVCILSLYNLKGEIEKHIIMKLQSWIKSNFSCEVKTPINPKEGVSLQKSVHSSMVVRLPEEEISRKSEISRDVETERLNVVMKSISLIFQIINETEREVDREYLLFRCQDDLYFNSFFQSNAQAIYENILKSANLNSKTITKDLMFITKQDSIIDMLIARKADVGVVNADYPNVFRIAAHHYNFAFIKRLIKLGVSPFRYENTDGLMKKVEYDLIALSSILPYYDLHRNRLDRPFLHTCIAMLDGSMKIFLSGRSNKRMNLIRAILLSQWKGSSYDYCLGPDQLLKKDDAGETAIFIAIRTLNLAAVKILLEKGISLLTKNKAGYYPLELFAKNKLLGKQTCHVISPESPWELKQIWYAIRQETVKQLSRIIEKTRTMELDADIRRLNDAELIDLQSDDRCLAPPDGGDKKEQFKGIGSLVFVPKKTTFVEESREEESDEEEEGSIEREVSYDGDDMDTVDDKPDEDEDILDESTEPVTDLGRIGYEDEEQEEEALQANEEDNEEDAFDVNEDEIEVEIENTNEPEVLFHIHPGMTVEQTSRLLDYCITFLNNIIHNPKKSSKEPTHIFGIISDAFLLIKFIQLKFKDSLKKGRTIADLIQLVHALVNVIVEKDELLQQIMLTFGSYDKKFGDGLLIGWASFLRTDADSSMRQEKLLTSSLCELFGTRHGGDKTILRLNYQDLKLMSTESENSDDDFIKVLESNWEQFSAVSYKVGFCCISNIENLMPTTQRTDDPLVSPLLMLYSGTTLKHKRALSFSNPSAEADTLDQSAPKKVKTTKSSS